MTPAGKHVILYLAAEARGRAWAEHVAATTDDLELRVWPDAGDLFEIDYLCAWVPPPGLFEKLPNLKAVFSVGAGVDQLDLAAIPAHLPVVRMLEPGIEACLTAWVAMAVLALHRDIPHYIDRQRAGAWDQRHVLPPSACRVGILGRGALGQSAERALAGLGFPVRSWSRSLGAAAYAETLATSDILVCLLPLTPETSGILNATTFAQLPRGAGLVNAGRGGHLVDADLLAALDSGQLGSAFLDVTDPEPLPPGHPFWTHPKILLTPHVGATTQTDTGIVTLVRNVRHHLNREPIPGTVDRSRGY